MKPTKHASKVRFGFIFNTLLLSLVVVSRSLNYCNCKHNDNNHLFAIICFIYVSFQKKKASLLKDAEILDTTGIIQPPQKISETIAAERKKIVRKYFLLKSKPLYRISVFSNM